MLSGQGLWASNHFKPRVNGVIILISYAPSHYHMLHKKGHCGTIPEDNSTQFPPDSESQDPVARCYKIWLFEVFCSLLTALLTTTVFPCQVAPQNCGSSARRKISKGRIFCTASRAAWVSILRCQLPAVTVN